MSWLTFFNCYAEIFSCILLTFIDLKLQIYIYIFFPNITYPTNISNITTITYNTYIAYNTNITHYKLHTTNTTDTLPTLLIVFCSTLYSNYNYLFFVI